MAENKTDDKIKEALKQTMLSMPQEEQEKESSQKSDKKDKKETPEQKKRKEERRKKLKARAKIMAGKVMKTLGKALKTAAKAMRTAAKAMRNAAKAIIRTANSMIQAAASSGPAAIVALPAALAVAVPMYATAGVMMAASVTLQAGAAVMEKAGAALEKGGAKLENSGRKDMQQANTSEGNSATLSNNNENTMSEITGKNDKDGKDNGKDDDKKINLLDVLDTAATMYMVYDAVKGGQSRDDLKATMSADQRHGTVQQNNLPHEPVANQMRADAKRAATQQESIEQAFRDMPANQQQVQPTTAQNIPLTTPKGRFNPATFGIDGRS